MAFQFPWTNFHELNLDWFLSKFKQFTNNFLETTATAESVPYNAQPSVTVTGGELDDDTDITDPFHFHFKIPQGMGILSLTITYNVTDDDTQPVSGWTTTKPAVNPGQYLWIKQTIILQNGVGQSYTYFVYYPVDGTITDIDEYPTENSNHAVTSGGVWNWFDKVSNNFAWRESSNTASRAYAVNDYVVINGALCKITAQVANGGTLTENVNYTVIGGNGGLGAELSDINNQLSLNLTRTYRINALSHAITATITANFRCVSILVIGYDMTEKTILGVISADTNASQQKISFTQLGTSARTYNVSLSGNVITFTAPKYTSINLMFNNDEISSISQA